MSEEHEARIMTVIDDERGKFELEFYRGLVFIHLAIRLPMEGMRAAKKLFPQVKAWLKSVGHEGVCVSIPAGDEKLYRFEQLFGFREFGRLNGRIIMGQEI